MVKFDIKNPFNGIERGLCFTGGLPLRSLLGNPFNGIESTIVYRHGWRVENQR